MIGFKNNMIVLSILFNTNIVINYIPSILITLFSKGDRFN
jgi:hypothetical protein